MAAEKVRYVRTLVPANKVASGEPVQVYVGRERSVWLVWFREEGDRTPIAYSFNRNEAIEFAVSILPSEARILAKLDKGGLSKIVYATDWIAQTRGVES